MTKNEPRVGSPRNYFHSKPSGNKGGFEKPAVASCKECARLKERESELLQKV